MAKGIKRVCYKKKRCSLVWVINILALFLISLKVFGLSNHIILIWVLLFEIYFAIEEKKILFDKKALLLLLCMTIHTLNYKLFGEKLTFGKCLDLILLPVGFYLMGKQMVYFPIKGKISVQRLRVVVVSILLGQIILSGLELYAYFRDPNYPLRVWADFWKGEELYATEYSFYAVIWVSLLFYSIWIIRKKWKLGLGLIVGIIIISYMNVLNGNRMNLGIMLVVFVFSFTLLLFLNRRNPKKIRIFLVAFVCFVGAIGLLIKMNVGGIQKEPYFQRLLILWHNERFEIYKDVLHQMPLHLWGGTQMELGSYGHAHNMWLQMYNDTGIITFTLMVGFTVFSLTDHIQIIIREAVETEIKYLLSAISLGLLLYLTFEVGGRGVPDFIMLYTFFAGITAEIVNVSRNKKKDL
ncbi:MAG: O-antigen ligase family protein [Lachnospiraceae bacterium]|nr:O-antigen ligase family protein [Lachnospiraceae bacterium]